MPDGSQPFDGNVEQVRAIVSQLAEQFAAKQGKPQHDQAFIDWFEKRVGERMRMYAFGAVVAYFVPLLIIAYTLGQMASTGASALEQLNKQNAVLASRGNWMAQQEQWQLGIQQWAESDPNRPFKPPMYFRGIENSAGKGID